MSVGFARTGARCGAGSPQNAQPADHRTEPPAGAHAQPLRIRIATWNVDRLFDTRCDTGRCGPGEYEPLPTEAELAAQGRRIAQGIRDLHADVVLLDEVEDEAALAPVRASLGDAFPYAAMGHTSAAASIDVVVLSRFPIVAVSRHEGRDLRRPDGSRTHLTRELLEVTLDPGTGTELVVFAAHFKSKRNDDTGRRFAEARYTGEQIAARAKRSPEALIVLGGDLNDTPDSNAIAELVRRGALFRVAADAPSDGTYLHGRTREAIDHLFIPSAERSVYVPGSARVVRTNTRGYAGSDHAALYADFVLQPR